MAQIVDNEDSGSKLDPETGPEKELVTYLTEHLDAWREYRDSNYLEQWEEYERIYYGKWALEDRQRESERSRIIAPATQQAVETTHAELMEAIRGDGQLFDIADDLGDDDPTDVEQLKNQLHEDFAKDKIDKSIEVIELLAEIYGQGIGEIVVEEKPVYKPDERPVPGVPGQVAYGVAEGKRKSVGLVPVNPKNFLWDPTADCIEDMLGCAVEKYVSLHKIVQGMEKGVYKKVEIEQLYDDASIEPTQEASRYTKDKVRLVRYYGLVPRELLKAVQEGAEESEEVVELFPEGSNLDAYDDLVEAIVVLANGRLLKAEENPYTMKDRPIVAHQSDIVPGRFIGRGTVEKAYNMQKAIDGTLRQDADSRSLTSAPMVAIDATRLPRGAKYEVKPGKSLLTNGNPNEILMPFKFGQADESNANAAQNYERMLLQATATVDSAGMVSKAVQADGGGGMSLSMAGIIKKYKRKLTNFQSDFLIPFINKAAWRYMQFDPERYPSKDLTFTPTGCLGIIAREYEQMQLTNLLKTLGPETPVLPILLKGIVVNSSLRNRNELMAALEKMSQPDPEKQALMQQVQMLEMKLKEEEVKKTQSETLKNVAQTHLLATQTEIAPVEAQAKLMAATTNNLPGDQAQQEFENRLKLTEVALKAEDLQQNRENTAAQLKMHEDKMHVEHRKVEAAREKHQAVKSTLES